MQSSIRKTVDLKPISALLVVGVIFITGLFVSLKVNSTELSDRLKNTQFEVDFSADAIDYRSNP